MKLFFGERVTDGVSKSNLPNTKPFVVLRLPSELLEVASVEPPFDDGGLLLSRTYGAALRIHHNFLKKAKPGLF